MSFKLHKYQAALYYQNILYLSSALLITGAFGNVAVFTSLVRSRRRKSRVNLLMTHLAVADMIVTFIVIPLEVSFKNVKLFVQHRISTCKIEYKNSILHVLIRTHGYTVGRYIFINHF